jgi:excisionase family DNA binding protein
MTTHHGPFIRFNARTNRLQVVARSPAAPPSAPPGRAARPLTPENLGLRWGCSAEKIRQMFHHGELAGFRLGKLIRIPAVEVERYECALTPLASATSSSPTEENLLSRSDAARIVADTRRELMTRAWPG